MHPWEMTQSERDAEIQRLRVKYRTALSAPLMSAGSVSGYQVARMGKRARKTWEQDTMIRMEVESRIRRLNDPEGERKVHENTSKDKAASIASAQTSRIKDLTRLGVGKSGKIRPTYQRAINETRQQMAEAIASYPDLIKRFV